MTLPEDDLTQQLIEELDAFCANWRTVYPTMLAAASAAGLQGLLSEWQGTEAGKRYLVQFSGVPDRESASKRAVDAYRHPRSLPFGYDNLGQLGGDESAAVDRPR